jgi:hypothetical protein
MIISKLPGRLAIVGILVGLSLMTMWWYIDTYNPFHLPTSEQAMAMGTNYSAPALYKFLDKVTSVLCPALWLQVFTMDMGRIVNYSIWVLAALFDGLIFYCIGLLIKAALNARLARP